MLLGMTPPLEKEMESSSRHSREHKSLNASKGDGSSKSFLEARRKEEEEEEAPLTGLLLPFLRPT